MVDAVESTKRSIQRRRERQQRKLSVERKKQNVITQLYDQESLQIEHSLEKLNQSEQQKNQSIESHRSLIRYEDFTQKDKEIFLQMFVSHPATFKYFHEAIFGKKHDLMQEKLDIADLQGMKNKYNKPYLESDRTMSAL